MKNSKGFTLIELLAVIIILAIVALVTTPAILNVINDSRIKGAEDKAWGTIDAVKLAYTQSQYKDDGAGITLPIEIDFSSDTNALTVNMSGERPTSGKVKMTDTGVITCEDLVFVKNGTYKCSTDAAGNEMTCTAQ